MTEVIRKIIERHSLHLLEKITLEGMIRRSESVVAEFFGLHLLVCLPELSLCSVTSYSAFCFVVCLINALALVYEARAAWSAQARSCSPKEAYKFALDCSATT